MLIHKKLHLQWRVAESRRVGLARGDLLLYYTLGSDPALWPAGERREGEFITHDKGYYHSYLEEALMPNYLALERSPTLYVGKARTVV